MLKLLFSLVMCVSLQQPLLLCAHTGKEPLTNGQNESFGLEERLGSRIPLDLAFKDEAGKPVLLGDLLTVPTLIIPVYFHCANVCNYQQVYVAGVLKSLNMRPVRDYRIISVSFDENETPELAAKSKRMYLASMNAGFPADGWHFLTGDRNSIRRFTDAIGFRVERRGEDFVHPVASLVVTRDGAIVRYLYGVSILPKDLALALTEAERGITGPSVRKLLEYCYTYDPAAKTYVFNLLRISAAAVILVAGSFLAYLIFGGRKRKKPPLEK
ncbi:MAG: SCO family protein [Geobacteraceae bacterium]|nr:SCO family protein [Geobacteraceae bacterium]